MLSKQEKQKYGEILRQQMKEKQQRKKLQDMEKRGQIKQLPISKEQPIAYKPTAYEKQNTYQRPFVDPKQQLQKKLQIQDYNYFGGVGGGAPNRRIPQQNVTNLRNMSHPNNLRLGAEEMMQFSGGNKQYPNQYQNNAQQRVRTISQQEQFYQAQNLQNQMDSISPQSINYPKPVQNGYYHETGLGQGSVGRISNPYQLQPPPQNYPQYNNGYTSNRQQPRQPISYELIPQNPRQLNSRLQQNIPQNQYQMAQNYSQPGQNQSLTHLKPPPYQIPPQNLPVEPQMQYQMEDSNNEQLQEVYKKGGRNLLKLENQTIDQHMIKQKRKLQIQKQLKQQIQQAQRRKKQEKQRLKREQEEQERKHMAYLAQQKRKVQEEQRKAKQAQQRIQQQNRKNQELRIQMQEQAKRKVEQERANKQRIKNQNLRLQQQQKRQQQQFERQKNRKPHQSTSNSRVIVKPSARITEDDNSSEISSETSELEKGFNTAMSKQFFRKQRQRKNPSDHQDMQKVTQEIKKMNYEIMQQRKQFTKVINERQIAEIQKKKAMQEVQRLKMELKKKMDEDNQKLLRALQGDYKSNDFERLPPQNYKNLNENQISAQNYENQYPTFAKKPMRQRQHQQLVQKQYEPRPAKYIPKEQEANRFQQSNVGLISLDGESKKIPLFLQHSDKLTMSQVQDFAKDSAFFHKGSNNRLNQSPPRQKYNARINQSIAQEADQDRDYVNSKSRQSNRNKQTKKESSLYRNQQDELDKLMESRAKSRGGWGQMSSVNSDITKEIDDLLKKKQNGLGSNNGRPNSISNAGKQSLSKQGYAYDGLTLNSNVGGGIGTINTNGTLDLQRINGRNEARLKELRNLGVETINTVGDDDLNNLDRLLNKYKGN